MKLFNIPKGSDHLPIPTYTKKYQRETESNGKKHVHRPKVQRLVTPLTLQRKRRRVSLRKRQIEKVRGPLFDMPLSSAIRGGGVVRDLCALVRVHGPCV
jgi:small subunit ribosomal protein S6e